MRRLTTLILLLAVTAGVVAQGEEASFQGLGFLPGFQDRGQARGVSADGSTVVGFTERAFSFPPLTLEREEAFRWTAAGGMVGLGNLPADDGGLAVDVSSDGSVIVGLSGMGAFRWTSEAGMAEIGDVPGVGATVISRGVSADGSVVVGSTMHAAFRWTAAEGAVMLPHLDISDPRSEAFGVSGDGSVVVGRSSGMAFRWTAATGTVSLGDLPPGYDTATALAISADGLAVAGSLSSGQSGEHTGFRWTEVDGYTVLGDLPGGDVWTQSSSVSADGSFIVGRSKTGRGYTAYVWDEGHGMRDLSQVLTNEYGLDLSGWWLEAAWDISGDGSVIVGSGVNPDGKEEAWRAVLSSLVLPGDVNRDGQVDGLDVDSFVDVLLDSLYQVEADMNEDQAVNGLDVDPFVAAVVGGGAHRIPEPSTLLLALVALGVVGGWRKWGDVAWPDSPAQWYRA